MLGKITTAISAMIGLCIVALVIGLIIGLPVMLLWNWIMVGLGLPAIGFFEAVGLVILLHILFPSSSS